MPTFLDLHLVLGLALLAKTAKIEALVPTTHVARFTRSFGMYVGVYEAVSNDASVVHPPFAAHFGSQYVSCICCWFSLLP